MPSDDQRLALDEDGFFVWRGAVDADALSAELDRTLAVGTPAGTGVEVGGGRLSFRFVPMMGPCTPHSLALLDRLAPIAASLLGTSVLPVRAKGTEYSATARWHRDSAGPARSLGFLAYLAPLRAETGALRVIPGSHRAPFADPAEDAPGLVLETDPGDLIVLHERLLHGSAAREAVGHPRPQWRVDFVADEDDDTIRAYYAAIFPPDWDGGYDPDRFPSYGADWRAWDRPWVARLEALGVYALAERAEAFSRARHA